MKAGKIWGQTELVHKNGVLEFHRIEFKAGAKCSEHKHKFKWNFDGSPLTLRQVLTLLGPAL